MSFMMTIAGRSVAGETTFDVINPATEEVVAQAPECTREQLEQAMTAAQEAFPGWSGLDHSERREIMLAAADAFEAAEKDLIPVLTAEQGKPLNDSEFEATLPARWIRHYAGIELPQEEVLQENELARSILTRRPLGVIAGITPWNFPIYQVIEKIAPGLIVGNTAVIKPSPYTPLTTLMMGEIVRDILPAGVLNIVSGGDDLGRWMTEHPIPRKVSFTGSIATGRKVNETAASDFKRVTLELGGNDPAIVLADVDVADAASKIFWVGMGNCGQICNAVKRVYAHESIYEEVVEALAEIARGVKVGNGAEPGVHMGPLNNKAQQERVIELTADAIANGAVAVTGGKAPEGPGYFFEPTILRDARDGMRIVDEEQFGPVLPVIPFSDVEDVIESANNSDFGLSGSVWTQDLDQARSIAARLDTGTVHINAHMVGGENICFGGVKHSGVGQANGMQGMLGYTEIKVINTASGWEGVELPTVMDATGVG